jgi:hypothetical protein
MADQNPVELCSLRKLVQARDKIWAECVARCRQSSRDQFYRAARDLGRLPQPALDVASDPRDRRQILEKLHRLARPGSERRVVAAEQIPRYASAFGILKDGLEGGQVPVDVVQHGYRRSVHAHGSRRKMVYGSLQLKPKS